MVHKPRSLHLKLQITIHSELTCYINLNFALNIDLNKTHVHLFEEIFMTRRRNEAEIAEMFRIWRGLYFHLTGRFFYVSETFAKYFLL